MFDHHYEDSADIAATDAAVFAFVDDHAQFSSHMSESSWMMGGSQMSTRIDEGKGQAVGSHIVMTVEDVAELLRTTTRAIYAMVERRQLPGIVRIGRRVLFRSADLLNWLNQKSAPSHRSEQR